MQPADAQCLYTCRSSRHISRPHTLNLELTHRFANVEDKLDCTPVSVVNDTVRNRFSVHTPDYKRFQIRSCGAIAQCELIMQLTPTNKSKTGSFLPKATRCGCLGLASSSVRRVSHPWPVPPSSVIAVSYGPSSRETHASADFSENSRRRYKPENSQRCIQPRTNRHRTSYP